LAELSLSELAEAAGARLRFQATAAPAEASAPGY